MRNYLLIDVSHLFHRAKHMAKGNEVDRAGFCLHLLFACVGKVQRMFNADHIVFAFDGSSWRKAIYPPYKRQRIDKSSKATPEEKEETAYFFEVLTLFKEYLTEKTNCTVLDNPILEADDLIAGFIQAHPNDKHIIVSGDKDFEQLITDNVWIYDGVKNHTITLTGVTDDNNKQVLDKFGKPIVPNPAFALFEKSVKGCSTDNIFSSYPGIRMKSSKCKVGLEEAFDDRIKQGFPWAAVMMHRWTDHEGIEHITGDDYQRNVTLVDLKKQPEEVKELIQETIQIATSKPTVSMVGIHFAKFCNKHELVKLGLQSTYFGNILNKRYV